MASNKMYTWISTLFEITDFTPKFLSCIHLKGDKTREVNTKLFKQESVVIVKIFQNNYNPF